MFDGALQLLLAVKMCEIHLAQEQVHGEQGLQPERSVLCGKLCRKERVIKTCIYHLSVLGGVIFSGEDGVGLAERKEIT